MLEVDAEFWWVGTKRLLEGAQTYITWEIFKMHFYEKYFPVSMSNAKELEFMILYQGTMNIIEYTTKFEEVSKFSTIYQRNPDEQWKCIKFEGGLGDDILASVGPMEICDYAMLVNKCLLVEDCNCKLAMAKSEMYKKKLVPQGQKFKQQPPKKPFQSGGFKGKQPQKLAGNLPRLVKGQVCPKCGKHHVGHPCYAGQNVCFRCGKLRYMTKDYTIKLLPLANKPQH